MGRRHAAALGTAPRRLSPRAPIVVRIAWWLAPTFGARRFVVRAWIWWDTDYLAHAIRRTWWRMRHPVLAAQVSTRVRLLQQGVAVLDA